MPGSAVPTFAVRPLVAENTATSVDENALKATTTPAIADPASHSGLATPRLVVLDVYFGSRTDMEVEYLPRPLSFPGIALFCVCDSFHPRPRLIPHHQTEHYSGAVSKFPRPEVCCSRWFPCWRFSCSSWFEMRKGRSRSTVVPPTRVTETAAAGNPELFWKGGAQTPRQGLLSAFPGLASLAHAALCPSSPLHQRAMQHYPRLVHHLPQRSGRTGIKKKVGRPRDGSACRPVDSDAPSQVSVHASRDGRRGVWIVWWCWTAREPLHPLSSQATVSAMRAQCEPAVAEISSRLGVVPTAPHGIVHCRLECV